MRESCARNDLVGTNIAWTVWYLPGALLAVGLFWSEARVWLWTPALAVAGVACVVNAARCGRLHCYATGPLCLLGAACVLLAEFHLVPMNPVRFLFVLVGAGTIAYLAEVSLGKYVKKA